MKLKKVDVIKGKVDNLYKIVDKLVAIRNKSIMQPTIENEFNHILSELQFYNKNIDYTPFIANKFINE
jgi:hypothetical protein